MAAKRLLSLPNKHHLPKDFAFHRQTFGKLKPVLYYMWSQWFSTWSWDHVHVCLIVVPPHSFASVCGSSARESTIAAFCSSSQRAFFTTKIAWETISEHLRSEIFLREHAPSPSSQLVHFVYCPTGLLQVWWLQPWYITAFFSKWND